eukprot:07356_3
MYTYACVYICKYYMPDMNSCANSHLLTQTQVFFFSTILHINMRLQPSFSTYIPALHTMYHTFNIRVSRPIHGVTHITFFCHTMNPLHLCICTISCNIYECMYVINYIFAHIYSYEHIYPRNHSL